MTRTLTTNIAPEASSATPATETIFAMSTQNFYRSNSDKKRLTLALILFGIGILGLFAMSASAQRYLNGPAPQALQAGSVLGSYSASGIDNVNLYNGRLNISVPLHNVGGRGEAGYQITVPVTYGSWVIEPSEMGFANFVNIPALKGWEDASAGNGPGLVRKTSTIDECPDEQAATFMLTRIVFTAPDGGETELLDANSNGNPQQTDCENDSDPHYNRGTLFRSVDGSNLTFVADSTIYDYWVSGPSTVSGVLIFPDGTRYRIDNGGVSWIEDRNGNRTTYSSAGVYTDSNGREIGFWGIQFKGTDGETRTITVERKWLSDVLAAGEMLQDYSELFPDTWNGPLETFTEPHLVSKIILPDGRFYEFKYNSYGEPARIVLPTGAAIEYTHGPAIAGSPTGGLIDLYWDGNIGTTGYMRQGVYRRVLERREYPDGGTGNNFSLRTVYAGAEVGCGGDLGSRVVANYKYDGTSSGTLIGSTAHFFEGAPCLSLVRTVHDFGNWDDGREWKTITYDASNNPMVTVEHTWDQGDGAPNSRTWFPRIEETKTTLNDTNQVSKKTFTYDANHRLTDTYEYDWGSATAGSFLRRSHTDYVSDSSYTTCNGATSRCMKALPSQTWVSSDSGGSDKVSLTQFEYDVYSTNSTHAGLVPRGSVTGHNSTNYGTSFAHRGNMTAATSYANAAAPSGSVSSYSQYDILGNVVKTIDGNGNATTIGYGDNFGTADSNATTNSTPSQISGYSTFAFPTSTTNPYPFNWTSYAQYDYFTGAHVNSQDSNGLISKTIYDDDLDRPTKTVANLGTAFERQSNIVYDDATRRVETKGDLNALNDDLIKSESFYDGLGRTTESRNYKDGGYVATKTEYDALGRIKRTSNPFRPHLSESELWTEMTYDALGRVTKVKTPDNAEVNTSYSGNSVTVEDQADKLRRSVTNALGQLTRIDEPNSINALGAIGSPNQATYYYYNTLGKMVRVQQGDQNRYFMHDSLGRLLRVRQPEQTVNTALNTSGNPDNNSWTAAFTYDNNGNVLTTMDAKDTTVTSTYDTLNRPLTRTYEDGTPTVSLYYDGAGLPSVPANSKGKISKVTSSVSESRYTQFDLLGRNLEYQQITDGQTYTSGYEYNFAGALVKETYPSGRVVQNEFDADGELSRIYGKVNPSATEYTFANSFTYTADGRIKQLRLGNGLWETAQFNNRLQVTEFDLGTAAGASNVWKNAYEYGELQTNGTVDATKNTGNIGKQTVEFAGLAHAFVQTYKYDPLYRLTEAKETNNGNQTWKQEFGYDRYGNRTTYDKWLGTTAQTLTTVEEPAIDNATNRISSSGFTFDANGNLTVDAEGRQFTFNGDNKQTEVKDDQNVTIGQYYYDGEGKRIKKVVGADTTVFVYSGGKLVAEYSTETPPSNPTISYTVTDQLGSPRVVVDASGAVVSRRDFMPFGEELAADGSYRTTAQKYGQDDSVRQKFTGYQRDEETGLDFAEARMYQNLNGRFTAIDPLLASGKSANPQTFNRYVYVMNSPLILTDPSGMQAGEEIQIHTWISRKTGEMLEWVKSKVTWGGQSSIIFSSMPAYQMLDDPDSFEYRRQKAGNSVLRSVSFGAPSDGFMPFGTPEQVQNVENAINTVDQIGVFNFAMTNYRFSNGQASTGDVAAGAAILGANFIPGGRATREGAEQGFTRLFRAVSQGELDDIAGFGIRSNPNLRSYTTVKLFATSAEDAVQFGRNNYRLDNVPNFIISADVPNSVIRRSETFSDVGRTAIAVPSADFERLRNLRTFHFSPIGTNR